MARARCVSDRVKMMCESKKKNMSRNEIGSGKRGWTAVDGEEVAGEGAVGRTVVGY